MGRSIVAGATVVVSAVVVLAVLAGSYQPLAYGQMESSVLAFPGLRAGQGIRTVNNVGGFSEDFFVASAGRQVLLVRQPG